MNVEQARFNMIEQQIRPWDVHDESVRHLLTVVHREDFVPPQHRLQAFVDMELPLKADTRAAVLAGQVMLPPRVEARMLQELQLKGDERVLHIGTGSGYFAALLGHKAKEVTSLELDAGLAETARANIARACIANVHVLAADGATADMSAHAPFDAIVLTGSVGLLPEALAQLLAEGGRLLAVVGTAPLMRATVVRREGGGLVRTQPWDVVIPPLQNFAKPPAFRF